MSQSDNYKKCQRVIFLENSALAICQNNYVLCNFSVIKSAYDKDNYF